MPVFDSKILSSDLDGLALLASMLHPTKQSRTDAVRRGQTLAKGGVTGKAINSGRRLARSVRNSGTSAA